MALAHIQTHVNALRMPAAFDLILPDAVEPGERLPVLVLLHDYGEAPDAWLRHTDVERLLCGRRWVAVLPQGNQSFFEDLPTGSRYRTWILQDLPAYLRALTVAGDALFLCGVGMGGYAAIGCAAACPPNVWAAAAIAPDLSARDAVRKYGIEKPQWIWPDPDADARTLPEMAARCRMPLGIACAAEDAAGALGRQLARSDARNRFWELPRGDAWQQAQASIAQILDWFEKEIRRI